LHNNLGIPLFFYTCSPRNNPQWRCDHLA